MITKHCVACFSLADLENHHLLPRSCGGGDEETNLITLCSPCHGRVHGMIRQNISALTKAGLQRARERGVVLGNPRMREVRAMGTAAYADSRKAKRDELVPVIGELRAAGITRLDDIAHELNRRGLVTVTGKPWTARRVSDFDYNCKRVS